MSLLAAQIEVGVTLKCFSAEASEQLAIVEEFGFGCSVGTIGTNVPGVTSR